MAVWRESSGDQCLATDDAATPILPTTRCGFYYDDKWISPYLRVEFDLPAGAPVLEFEVYNPQNEEFLDARMLVRLGLVTLYHTEPLEIGRLTQHTIELPVLGERDLVSISFRSSVRWRAPPPDQRALGLILPSLFCWMAD